MSTLVRPPRRDGPPRRGGPPRPGPSGSSSGPPRLPRLPVRLRFLRLLIPVGVLALALVVVLLGGLLVVGQFTGGGDQQAAGTCDAGRPAVGVPRTAADLAPGQRQAAATIVGGAQGVGAPAPAGVVAAAN